MDAALYARLVADAAVSALTTRVYPVRLPDKAVLPAIRFFRVSTDRPSTMGADAGIAGARYQVDCWAVTQLGMIDLRDKLRQALQRWRDSGGSPVIQDTFIEAERDHGWEPDVQAFRGGIDALIWAEE